ncbi:MAG: HlyC/CorC family transporter [Lachnospiraceae bacterium]|nr:HlyC/CorC family transporter [Lachnospiraceae bacterium]
MEDGVPLQLIILVILLILSAFFSSAETALTTVSLVKMRSLANEGDKRAARVIKVREDPGRMLSAILIGNNLVNISASSLATSVAISIVGSVGAGIATGILTFLILIFGEITPKTMATLKANELSLYFAGPIWMLMRVFTPVIFIVNHISIGLLRMMGISRDDAAAGMTPEELRLIVDASHESGKIEEEEKDYIHKLFDFSDATAREVMIPRIDMTMVDVNTNYDELIKLFEEVMYTRLPVYEDESDNIIGIINMKDLLLYDRSTPFSIRSYLRETYFTYEQKNTADLFDEMREGHISIAIVLDEYGAVAGLVTLEDLLEELVGEIRDEYDQNEVDDIVECEDGTYDVLGSSNLEDLCDELPLGFTSEDYDTIGGYLTGAFDHFPGVGETYVTETGIILRVISVRARRIEKINIRIPQGLMEKEKPAASEADKEE